jgi:hypothetical protein
MSYAVTESPMTTRSFVTHFDDFMLHFTLEKSREDERYREAVRRDVPFLMSQHNVQLDARILRDDLESTGLRYKNFEYY